MLAEGMTAHALDWSLLRYAGSTEMWVEAAAEEAAAVASVVRRRVPVPDQLIVLQEVQPAQGVAVQIGGGGGDGEDGGNGGGGGEDAGDADGDGGIGEGLESTCTGDGGDAPVYITPMSAHVAYPSKSHRRQHV